MMFLGGQAPLDSAERWASSSLRGLNAVPCNRSNRISRRRLSEEAVAKRRAALVPLVAASGQTKKLLIVVTVVIGVLAIPVAATARGTAAQAREALIRAQVTPRPLYPDILPPPLGIQNSATFTHGHFFVWKGPDTNPGWFSIKYRCRCHYGRNYLVNLTFSRGPVSDIAKAINLSRTVQGRPVGRVRIHGHWMHRFQTDMWFGYMWKQQGFAYSVFARYSPRVGWEYMRKFVKSLYPVGHLWTGRTSQGQQVSLYLSRGGLDWFLFDNFNCADGSPLSGGWDEDLVGVNRDGTFADSYAYNWTTRDGTRQHETLSMRGKFPASTGASVTGSFDAHSARVHHPRERSWNCGAKISWQASPF
jgi:hypothetical protein